MYKDPYNHSLGTEACVEGYEFQMEGNEWNVISEVSLSSRAEELKGNLQNLYDAGH